MQFIQEVIQLKETKFIEFANELDHLLAKYFWDKNDENELALSNKTVQIIDLEFEINELQMELEQS